VLGIRTGLLFLWLPIVVGRARQTVLSGVMQSVKTRVTLQLEKRGTKFYATVCQEENWQLSCAFARPCVASEYSRDHMRHLRLSQTTTSLWHSATVWQWRLQYGRVQIHPGRGALQWVVTTHSTCTLISTHGPSLVAPLQDTANYHELTIFTQHSTALHSNNSTLTYSLQGTSLWRP
jgi:hypothetical protein